MRYRPRIRCFVITAVVVLVASCAPLSGSHDGTIDAAVDNDDALADWLKIDGGGPARVRIMAANLSSGNYQSYQGPGIRIFQGLRPDIVLIQEFNYLDGDHRSLVDSAFGADFEFYVEPRIGGIPNGIVSRYPILQSGVWTDVSTSDRAFAYARIDIPGTTDLWAISVHLLSTSAGARATEVNQLLGYISTTVPATDFLVIGGDLNTGSTSEQALVKLSATVDTKPPWPTDKNGNHNTSINRNYPYDWVLARANVDAFEVPVVIGGVSYPTGLVFDSRVYTPLADVAPILANDSVAWGMQHMAVAKDFVFAN